MNDRLRLLDAISGSYYFAIGLFYPLYAAFIRDIGGSTFIAGSAFSAYSIAAGIMIYFFSRWERGKDQKERLLVVGYAVATLCFAGYYVVETPMQMVLVQAVLGGAVALRTPAFDDVYSRSIDGDDYAWGWGHWESMYWIVSGISAFTGGFIVTRYGFDTLFIMMAGLGAASTVLAARLAQQ
ncbi:MAG: MFS transporter [Candidatus Nanohaloarchaea archaeon]|nr:MFS transporter [Candidatus Nanohaloarchaea archaeon]